MNERVSLVCVVVVVAVMVRRPVRVAVVVHGAGLERSFPASQRRRCRALAPLPCSGGAGGTAWASRVAGAAAFVRGPLWQSWGAGARAGPLVQSVFAHNQLPTHEPCCHVRRGPALQAGERQAAAHQPRGEAAMVAWQQSPQKGAAPPLQHAVVCSARCLARHVPVACSCVTLALSWLQQPFSDCGPCPCCPNKTGHSADGGTMVPSRYGGPLQTTFPVRAGRSRQALSADLL